MHFTDFTSVKNKSCSRKYPIGKFDRRFCCIHALLLGLEILMTFQLIYVISMLCIQDLLGHVDRVGPLELAIDHSFKLTNEKKKIYAINFSLKDNA